VDSLPNARRSGPHLAALVAVIALVLAACSGGAAPAPTIPPDATNSIAPAATGKPVASAAAVTFPLKLTDDEGTSVLIAKEPAKIVSLTPATTETLFALGVGDRIVGKGSDFFLYPPAASAIPDVQAFDGTQVKVDVEKIAQLAPDVVFAGGNFGTPPDDIERLRSLGLPVVVVYAPTIQKVLDDIR
jgi:iron complex transport system substrate-binding protein